MSINKEGFRPIKHEPPTSFAGKLKFYGRMLLDLQILTIYSDTKKQLPNINFIGIAKVSEGIENAKKGFKNCYYV